MEPKARLACALLVPPSERMRELHELLLALTPRVEPVGDDVFFLDPSGLSSFHANVGAWGEAVRDALGRHGAEARVVVGFVRDRMLALARTGTEPVRVLGSPREEEALCRDLPLSAFGAPPELVRHLGVLSVRSVAELLRLPPLELAMRFGDEARDLHARASGLANAPFAPSLPLDPVRASFDVEPPDDDVERLLFLVKGTVDRMMAALVARAEALVALVVDLGLDHAPRHVEVIRPAAPTRETVLIVDLLRLRLGTVALRAKVKDVTLIAEGLRVHGRHAQLFEEPPARDVAAAGRALARLRAVFGDEAVVGVELVDAHLPEARFALTPTSRVALPRSVDRDSEVPLVRRLHGKPVPLAEDREGRPLLLDRIVAMHGPYRVTGGWWRREVRRDYYYVETDRGGMRLVYRDDVRRRWFLHAEVD